MDTYNSEWNDYDKLTEYEKQKHKDKFGPLFGEKFYSNEHKNRVLFINQSKDVRVISFTDGEILPQQTKFETIRRSKESGCFSGFINSFATRQSF